MLNEHFLPLNDSPPIIGYMHHAHPLSILSTERAYLPWFYSNYIQLISNFDALVAGDARGFNFLIHAAYPLLISPFLDIQWLNRCTLTKMYRAISDFIVDSLVEGYYVQLFVNEFYIPDRRHYQSSQYAHEILVYGFNIEANTCNIIGYNAAGKYKTSTLSFKALDQAFSSLVDNPHLVGSTKDHIYIQNKVWLGKYLPAAEYDFDGELVRDLLEDFLDSKDTSARSRMVNAPTAWGAYQLAKVGTYGIDSYQCLSQYLEVLSRDKSLYRYVPMHVLWEHKRCMVSRFKFMEEHGLLNPKHDFTSAYKVVERMAENLRLMMLKFAIGGEQKIIPQMIKRLGCMEAHERPLLNNVLNELQMRG